MHCEMWTADITPDVKKEMNHLTIQVKEKEIGVTTRQ